MKRDRDAPEESAIERKIVSYAKIGIPVATFVAMLIAGVTQGPPLAVLVLAAGALIGVITALWASLRALLGETPLTGADAYAIAAPRAEEEQKRAVLRALKDLEFERSVGKITEDDYRDLVGRYRAEAKRLLRALDEEAVPRRAQAEELLETRLHDAGLGDDATGPSRSGDDEPGETDDSTEEAERRDRKARKKRRKREKEQAMDREKARTDEAKAEAPKADGGRACSSCGTTNDDDAVFCKKCGQKQEPA